MSRLIDADKFMDFIKDELKQNRPDDIHIRNIIRVLEDLPSAFDVDKVVEELEKLKDKALKRREELIELNSYNNIILKNIEYERGREYAFDDAIEIVRNGGDL